MGRIQYQLALHQIDSMQKDGKFIGADGSIPEGQGIVMAHLAECHELVEIVSNLASGWQNVRLLFVVERCHGGR